MIQIVETRVGDVTVVRIAGERLDMATGPKFRRLMATIDPLHNKVVLDMEQVRFVDSSGFGAILSCMRDLTDAGGGLKLCQVHKRVRVLLELVRVHRVVPILNTVEEAVAAFAYSTAAANGAGAESAAPPDGVSELVSGGVR